MAGKTRVHACTNNHQQFNVCHEVDTKNKHMSSFSIDLLSYRTFDLIWNSTNIYGNICISDPLLQDAKSRFCEKV